MAFHLQNKGLLPMYSFKWNTFVSVNINYKPCYMMLLEPVNRRCFKMN